MHPDLQRYLDGELPRESLPAAAEAELAAWERLDAAASARREVRAPEGLESGVMNAIAVLEQTTSARDRAAVQGARDPVPVHARLWRWLVTPRPLQVRPLAPLAAAAVLVLVVLTQTTTPRADLAQGVGGVGAEEPVIYVQFTLTAEGARTVSVAGDFNDWSVEAGTLRDADGSGVWRGLIAVRPGVHKYMFVVDGEEWITDPAAERYVDDGFGMRNALLAVVPPAEVL